MGTSAQRLFEVDERVPELTFQHRLTAALEARGWTVCQQIPRRTRQGWRSGASSPGWPDIVALRKGWLIAIEAKVDHQYPRPDQRAWLARFAEMPQALTYVLRPADDWDEIMAWFSKPAAAPAVYGWGKRARAA